MGFKYCVTLPVAAVSVFVAIPYSISFVTQALYGWPNNPGYKKYLEALRPRRIYRLTRAVLEMMKYLQYGKLYFKWTSWYKKEEKNKLCVKGISFGRRGKKMDLFHSPGMRSSDAELIPVVVFVYRGGRGSGERSMYCLLALQLAKELRVSVICPDYSIYPNGTVLHMTQDISDSLLWVRENGHSFSLDKDNIVLIGHSAGAHLCTLAALFLVKGVEELCIDPFKHREITDSIKGIVGLSGVYNIMEHYQHEKTIAVEYVSAMYKAMEGTENFEYYSPTALLGKLNEDMIKRVPPVGLLHGTDDVIVPAESSVRFSSFLASLSVKTTLYLLPEMDHVKIITDLMAPDRHLYHTIFSCIKQEYSKFM